MTWLEDALGGDVVVGLWTMAIGILAAVPCATLGVYLVLRRMSLLGDAISHAVLPGIAIGFMLSGRLMGPAIVLGAMAVGMLTALLSRGLSAMARVPEDSGMGVVFTSLFAVGVLLITAGARDVDLDPGCVLYGLIELAALDTVPIFGIELPRSLLGLGLATLLTAGFVSLLWKELKLTSFDPALATAVGLNAGIVHYALMAMVAGVTVAAFEAVGSILVVAMLIVPGATAHLMTDRLGPMMVWALVVAILSTILGYLGAVALNTSVAGMMSVAGGLIFATAVAFSPRHGLLSKLAHHVGLSMRIAREDVLARLYRVEEIEPGSGGASPIECLQWASVAAGPFVGRLAMAQLRGRGLVEAQRQGLALSDDGRREARGLVAAHRLWESYLDRNFELPADHLHEPAERIEHFIGPELLRNLSDDLESPQADPHGRAIPPDRTADA